MRKAAKHLARSIKADFQMTRQRNARRDLEDFYNRRSQTRATIERKKRQGKSTKYDERLEASLDKAVQSYYADLQAAEATPAGRLQRMKSRQRTISQESINRPRR